MNSELATDSYSNRQLSVDHWPRIVFVELTQKCNLSCDMCHYYKKDFSKNTMKHSNFSLIAESLFEHAEVVDLRGWGESVILPEFPRFVDVVSRHNAIPRVVTNLSYHNDNALEALAQGNALISISLDAADNEKLKTLRGGADFHLILSNVEKIRKFYSDFGTDFGNVSFGVTVQRDNIFELFNIVSLARTYGINKVSLFPRQNGGDFYPPMSKSDISDLKKELDRSMKLAIERGVSLRIGANLFPEMQCTVPSFSFPCIKPWEFCFISWDGYIGCCDFLIGPGSEKFSFGNIEEFDPLELWQRSSRAIEFRKSHITCQSDQDSFNQVCSWCYKHRYVDFEDFFEDCYVERVVDNSNWALE